MGVWGCKPAPLFVKTNIISDMEETDFGYTSIEESLNDLLRYSNKDRLKLFGRIYSNSIIKHHGEFDKKLLEETFIGYYNETYAQLGNILSVLYSLDEDGKKYKECKSDKDYISFPNIKPKYFLSLGNALLSNIQLRQVLHPKKNFSYKDQLILIERFNKGVDILNLDIIKMALEDLEELNKVSLVITGTPNRTKIIVNEKKTDYLNIYISGKILGIEPKE